MSGPGRNVFFRVEKVMILLLFFCIKTIRWKNAVCFICYVPFPAPLRVGLPISQTTCRKQLFSDEKSCKKHRQKKEK
jgi:hypothetical protein